MKVLIRHCLPHSSFDLFGWRQVKKPISKPSLITNISQTKDSCVNSIHSCVTMKVVTNVVLIFYLPFGAFHIYNVQLVHLKTPYFFSVVLFVKILSPLFLLLFLLFCLLKFFLPFSFSSFIVFLLSFYSHIRAPLCRMHFIRTISPEAKTAHMCNFPLVI